jgi:hypothetical protein
MEHKPIGANTSDIAVATAQMRDKLREFFERMHVPKKYFDLMYSVPATEVRWITQTELNTDIKGYVPDIRVILDEKCKLSRETEETTVTQKCASQIKTELRNEAWKKIFRDTR